MKVENPSAFARPFSVHEDDRGNELHYSQEGMTLLDFIAAHALPEFINNRVVMPYDTEVGDDEKMKECVKAAYTIASAMLKERINHL